MKSQNFEIWQTSNIIFGHNNVFWNHLSWNEQHIHIGTQVEWQHYKLLCNCWFMHFFYMWIYNFSPSLYQHTRYRGIILLPRHPQTIVQSNDAEGDQGEPQTNPCYQTEPTLKVGVSLSLFFIRCKMWDIL